MSSRTERRKDHVNLIFRTNTICDSMVYRSFWVRGVSACGITKTLSCRTHKTPRNEITMNTRLQYKLGPAEQLITLAVRINSRVQYKIGPPSNSIRITIQDDRRPPSDCHCGHEHSDVDEDVYVLLVCGVVTHSACHPHM